MTKELQDAIRHIKTRADAWAVKEIVGALEQDCDKDCENCDRCVDDKCPNDGMPRIINPSVKEPCNDAISREDTIVEIQKKMNEIRLILENMPSIQPSHNGHWIDEGQYAEEHNHHAYRCSECERHIIEVPLNLIDENPHCKYCGADMRGEE